MKTIIAGSRTITDYKVLSDVLNTLVEFPITQVFSGGARGVDSLAIQWAHEKNLPLQIFHADWDTHGKAAGPIRNQLMAAHAEALVALWDGKSRGTANMIEIAKKRRLASFVIVL